MLVGVGGDAGTLANKKLQCAIVLFFFFTYKSVTQLRAHALREARGRGFEWIGRDRAGNWMIIMLNASRRRRRVTLPGDSSHESGASARRQMPFSQQTWLVCAAAFPA